MLSQKPDDYCYFAVRFIFRCLQIPHLLATDLIILT